MIQLAPSMTCVTTIVQSEDVSILRVEYSNYVIGLRLPQGEHGKFSLVVGISVSHGCVLMIVPFLIKGQS